MIHSRESAKFKNPNNLRLTNTVFSSGMCYGAYSKFQNLSMMMLIRRLPCLESKEILNVPKTWEAIIENSQEMIAISVNYFFSAWKQAKKRRGQCKKSKKKIISFLAFYTIIYHIEAISSTNISY